MKKKDVIIVALATFCLSATMFIALPTWSQSSYEYDPWADVSGPTIGVPDGLINMRDVAYEIAHFNKAGTPIDRSSLMPIEYDSGWMNLTGETSQSYTISHNLNLANLDGMVIDARQRTSEWNRTYDSAYGFAGDWAESVIQTSDGGYAMAGYIAYVLPDVFHSWLVKTDSNGNAQWNKIYRGTDSETTSALVQTVDGGYALAGATSSSGAGKYDFWLVRTDSNGDALWNKSYGGATDDVAYALVQTVDGGYALAGATSSSGAGSYDFWLIKTDSNGNAQWNKTYGGATDDVAYALVQTGNGGYVLAGYTGSYGAGKYDFWLVKTDADGNEQWNRTYGGTEYDYAKSVVHTSDEGYALAGDTTSYGAGSDDFWLIKTDADGNEQWNRTYGGASVDSWPSAIQSSDGGYAILGTTENVTFSYSDFWLIKTDSNGNAQWNKTYGGTDYDYASSIVQTSDGGYALAGATESYGAGGDDFWLVKTGVESGLAWTVSTANTITIYSGATDPYWNFVRVRIWKPT